MNDIAEPQSSDFVHGDDTLLLTREAHVASRDYLAAAREAVRARPGEAGRWAARRLAWIAVEAACIASLQRRAETSSGDSFERALHRVAVGRALAALAGGVEVAPGEAVRPSDLGLEDEALAWFETPSMMRLRYDAASPVYLREIAQMLASGIRIDLGSSALARILWPAPSDDEARQPADAARAAIRACTALTIAALAQDPGIPVDIAALYQARAAPMLNDDAAERDRRETSLAAHLL
ncbi:MAG: Acyl-CoA dehydrogenase [Rhodospirillales bacterium]|nr:Acyl-CoA dehydrogenase [Rhodospirillales bacterium]